VISAIRADRSRAGLAARTQVARSARLAISQRQCRGQAEQNNGRDREYALATLPVHETSPHLVRVAACITGLVADRRFLPLVYRLGHAGAA
jgi:hypothetical protein